MDLLTLGYTALGRLPVCPHLLPLSDARLSLMTGLLFGHPGLGLMTRLLTLGMHLHMLLAFGAHFPWL